MKSNSLKIIALALVLASYGCSQPTEEKENIKTADTPAKVTTFPLQKDLLTSYVSIPAEIAAFTYVDLYAKVGSYVKELNVDIGSTVSKGQLLISLEAPEITSKLLAAEAQLHAAKAVYMASKTTYERMLETSRVEGTLSKNQLNLALATKNTDYAKLQAAKASYKEFQVMQSYLEIRAPFDGIITKRNINIGAYVGAPGKSSETPLLTLQDAKKLRMSLSVPESYASFVQQGDTVSYQVISIPGVTFQGTVARMSGALDSKFRSERIEIDIENNTSLKPGMIAEVRLSLTSKTPLYVVPKSSVLSYSEGTFVIKSIHGKALKIPVQKRREINGKVEIFSTELQENDLLITVASEEIHNGDALPVL